jgi:hypothetical protein
MLLPNLRTTWLPGQTIVARFLRTVARAPAKGEDVLNANCNSDPEHRLWERTLPWAILITAGAMLLALATPLLHGRVPSRAGDVTGFHLPLRDFYARCLHQGEAFDWMPELFCGFYLTGEGQIGPYHPLHLLLYRFVPIDRAMAFELVLPCALVFAGTVLLLTRYLPATAALLGALLFAFSFWFMGHLQHPNLAGVLAHTPWLLWTVAIAGTTSSGSRRLLACAGIAFLTGSAILLGHPQALWMVALTTVLYCVFLLVYHRPTLLSWAAILGGALLGLVIGAVQLLPTYSFFLQSTRAQTDSMYAMAYSLEPLTVLGLVAPCMVGGRCPSILGAMYLGVVPLTLAAWWLGAWCCSLGHENSTADPEEAPRDSTRATACGQQAGNALALFGLLLTIIMLWLSMGYFGGLYYFLTKLPVVGKFRAPARFQTMAQFGVMIIAAVAFARLLLLHQLGRKLHWRYLVAPWLIVVASLAVAAYVRYLHPSPPKNAIWGDVYLGPVLLAVTAGALTLIARGHRVGFVLLLVVAATDVIFHGYSMECISASYRGAIPWESIVARHEVPPDTTGRRVFTDDFYRNYLVIWGRRAASGYTGLVPRKQLDYDDIAALRVAEVNWYRTCEPGKQMEGLGPLKAGIWYPVANPLPRARLVSRAIVSQAPAEDIKTIDLTGSALVTHALSLSGSEPGTAHIATDRPGDIAVQVKSRGSQLLIVSESYDRGWQGSIDGVATTVERVNGDFLGCVVPEGSHHIVFRFRPWSLQWGRVLSLLGIALGLALCGVGCLPLFLTGRARQGG